MHLSLCAFQHRDKCIGWRYDCYVKRRAKFTRSGKGWRWQDNAPGLCLYSSKAIAIIVVVVCASGGKGGEAQNKYRQAL